MEEKKLVVRIRNMTFVESLRNRCDKSRKSVGKFEAQRKKICVFLSQELHNFRQVITFSEIYSIPVSRFVYDV